MWDLISDNMGPFLLGIFLALMLNTGILWVVVNKILGSPGDVSFLRCFICSLVLIPTMTITIIFASFLIDGDRGLYALIKGLIAFIVIVVVVGGGVCMPILDLEKAAARSVFIVFFFSMGAVYFVLSYIGINPFQVAEKARPAAHSGMAAAQFKTALKEGIIRQFEGQYNVGFVEDDLGIFPCDFQIRALDGKFTVMGSMDRAFNSERGRKVTPEEELKWIEANLKGFSSATDIDDYVEKLIAYTSSKTSAKDPNLSAAPGIVRVPSTRINPAVTAFCSNIIAKCTPDEATASQLLEWKPAPGDISTSFSQTEMPAAWDLVLNEKDLAFYQAKLDAANTKRADYTKGEDDTAGPANPQEEMSDPQRVHTVVRQKMNSPYGQIEIVVEVHRNEKTAAEDLYKNKLRLPSAVRMLGLMPVMLRGGDRYVAVYDSSKDSDTSGVRYYIIMESFHKNVWFRIKAPVQASQQYTNNLLKLMNMQQYKIAEMMKNY